MSSAAISLGSLKVKECSASRGANKEINSRLENVAPIEKIRAE